MTICVGVSVTRTVAVDAIAVSAGSTAVNGRSHAIAAIQTAASTASTRRPTSRHPRMGSPTRKDSQPATTDTTRVTARSAAYSGCPCTTAPQEVTHAQTTTPMPASASRRWAILTRRPYGGVLAERPCASG